MKYENAKRFLLDFQFIIGEYYEGGTIDELVIAPKGGWEFKTFIELLMKTENPEVAIRPFIGDDLTVEVIVDKILTNNQTMQNLSKDLTDLSLRQRLKWRKFENTRLCIFQKIDLP